MAPPHNRMGQVTHHPKASTLLKKSTTLSHCDIMYHMYMYAYVVSAWYLHVWTAAFISLCLHLLQTWFLRYLSGEWAGRSCSAVWSDGWAVWWEPEGSLQEPWARAAPWGARDSSSTIPAAHRVCVGVYTCVCVYVGGWTRGWVGKCVCLYCVIYVHVFNISVAYVHTYIHTHIHIVYVQYVCTYLPMYIYIYIYLCTYVGDIQ